MWPFLAPLAQATNSTKMASVMSGGLGWQRLKTERALVAHIAGRIGRALERRGLVERDLENA